MPVGSATLHADLEHWFSNPSGTDHDGSADKPASSEW
jgi:hypothetical protein